MLLGREDERRSIERVLAQARVGISSTLVLVGEPGIGKTALLEHAAATSTGMRILRARGVESEAEIPFGSLLELLRPALELLDRIPGPQVLALEAALALRPGEAGERFAVGAATLSLLAAYAEEAPVAVLIDDAHWLDSSSAQALLFAFRRLMVDPIAVLVAVREGEPSLIDGTDLPTLGVRGLARDEAGQLLDQLSPEEASRLYELTAGNPLAMLELARDARELLLAPPGVPVLVPARIADAFLRRAGALEGPARQVLTLAAIGHTDDPATLAAAARRLGLDISSLSHGEEAGLIMVRSGAVEFRHPLARSAVYAAATPEQRRLAHRALADVLPDGEVERRAWHLAAAAVGADETASAALEQAGERGWARSAYPAAAASFERAARLEPLQARRSRLLLRAAEAAWLGGGAQDALRLAGEARQASEAPGQAALCDAMSGAIAAHRGPVMHGHDILMRAAPQAPAETAVEMLAEAAAACLYAAEPERMLAAARQARRLAARHPSARAQFLSQMTLGTAEVLGGDAAAGARALHEAVAIAEATPGLRADLRLLHWLAIGPIFLREQGSGRELLEQALTTARTRAAIGVLPYVLNLIARDQATTDRWALAESGYREAIALGRESGQRTQVCFGLSGLAWLQARRGREADCRSCAAEALAIGAQTGTRLHEIWAAAALGELELGLGAPARALEHFLAQQRLLDSQGISDADLSPGPDLVDAYLRLGQPEAAREAGAQFALAATAKGQPWGIARARRCQAVLAPDPDSPALFEDALAQHRLTPDRYEEARTLLAYGERLRRLRERSAARTQLRAAIEEFERLGAAPWAERARTELAATGVSVRRRDPSTRDELTAQELQIALLLASGRTTRETAASLFLSPKTVEYHLRHVYLKLGINTRAQLAELMSGRPEPAVADRARG